MAFRDAEAYNAPDADRPWLKLARDANTKATNYFDNNYRKNIEDGLRMFQSRHPRDSKYNADAYKYRSRIFRPKTRSVVRKHEATAALAFFTNPDAMNVDPMLQDDPAQVMSALINKELLAYRLDKSIPWFLTVIGGFQDAMVCSLVASFQYWDYRTKKETRTVTGYNEQFAEVEFEEEIDVPVSDKPCCDLLPLENICFDPAAKWYDVARTSPYLILKMPMYLRDVLDHMEQPTGGWRKYTRDEILSARITSDEAQVRLARNDNREDPEQQTSEVNEFDVVMVHLNFINVDGTDHAFYTLKDERMLTDPLPTGEMFRHCDQPGDRPVVIGFCVLETHKAKPEALIMLGRDLQSEANEVANQRLDNVKYVLNKKAIIRRGANVDIEAWLRNVPGSAVMANDVEKDIRTIDYQDVTSSAYAEQDRINVDYDELLGNFAQSSVMTNRRMNETVGGMRMIAQGANLLTEYTIRVYVETWMEPVLRQLVKMEQYYETDEVILAIAAKRAGVYQQMGMSPQLDAILRQELTTTIHVGMGATDPDTRFQRFIQATGAYTQFVTQGPPDLNATEFRKELYGLAGFKDAERFFGKQDPNLIKAQQMLQQAEALAKKVVDGEKEKLMQREVSLNEREDDLDIREMELKLGARVERNDIRATAAVETAKLDNKEQRALRKIESTLRRGNGADRQRPS